MSTNRMQFLPGCHIKMHGQDWLIGAPAPDGRVTLQVIGGGVVQSLPRSVLVKMLTDRQLEFVTVAPRRLAVDPDKQVTAMDDHGLTDDEVKASDEVLTYINALEVHGCQRYKQDTWACLIARVAVENGFGNPPSPITLWRKRRRFEQSGRMRRSVIAGRPGGPPRTPRVDPDAMEFMQKTCEPLYLHPQRRSKAAVFEDYTDELTEYNKFANTPLVAVCKRTVERYLDLLPRKSVLETREGAKAAEAEHRVCHHAPKGSRILELVEYDHTLLDVLLIDDDSKAVLGRAALTIGLDVYSRCVHGIHIGYSPPSVMTVAEALKFGVLSKEGLSTQFPGIQTAWPVYGLPEVIIVDNAREFYSKGFLGMCQALGITVRFAKRKKPWWKPHIERLIKTITHGLVHELPGTTFSNVAHKRDYDSRKWAVVGFKKFQEASLVWINDLYHRRPHRGLARLAPVQVWERSAAMYEPAVPASREALLAVLGRHESRTIQRLGIEHLYLFYNSAELQSIRERTPVKQEAKVTVVIDDDDLDSVHVIDPLTRQSIKVPSLAPAYTKGLTLYQHRAALTALHAEGKRAASIQELAAAKSRALGIAMEALATPSKSLKKDIARYLNMKMTVQDGLELPSSENVSAVTTGDGAKSENLLLDDNELSLEGWSVSQDAADSGVANGG